MTYAINDLPWAIGNIGSGGFPNLHLSYACALLSELAYHHVPAWEIEAGRRALLIPCHAYTQLLRQGGGSNVRVLLAERDLARSFVAETPRVIAVGLQQGDALFIAMRGTMLMLRSDWRINLRAKLTDFPGVGRDWSYPWHHRLRVHSGFLAEAQRICSLIHSEMETQRLDPVRTYITGHSLGGAVAAVSALLLHRIETITCFGAPRQWANYPWEDPRIFPVHFRRPGDLVPLVPPRRLGYVDVGHEFTTDGQPFRQPPPFALRNFYVGPWLRFAASAAGAHAMETYRTEVGAAVGGPFHDKSLTSLVKLRPSDVST